MLSITPRARSDLGLLVLLDDLTGHPSNSTDAALIVDDFDDVGCCAFTEMHGCRGSDDLMAVGRAQVRD